MKGKSAITLVALIITIIVLLILATVSISLVINNGVLDKAQHGVDKYSEEEELEQIKLAVASAMLKGNGFLDTENLNSELRDKFGEGKEVIKGSDGWSLKLDKNYIIYENGNVEEGLEYITNGLILHLDGINNTRNGHSTTTTTWEDLSGNNNDFTKLSGASNAQWSDNSYVGNATNRTLVLNKAILSNTDECTVEVCYDIPQLKSYYWIFQNRQIDQPANGFQFVVNSTQRNNFLLNGIDNSNNNTNYNSTKIKVTDLGKRTMAFAINTGSVIFCDNGEIYTEDTKEGVINSITQRSCYSIGSAYPWVMAHCFEGNIYSIRVYNRKLSEEELKNNYEVDKIRFNIN